MNDNNKQMMRFRESFRGYNKDDVNAYIEHINLLFSEKERDYKKAINEKNEKIKEYTDSMPEKTITEEDLLKVKAKAELDAKAEARTEISGKEAIIKELTSKINALEEEITALKSRISELDSKKNAGDDGEKSKLYDSMSAKVGNILIIANNNADKIISDAKAEAKAIKERAETEAEQIKIEAAEKSKAMISAVNMKLKGASDGYIREYTDLINDIKLRFEELNESIKKSSEKLPENIAEIKNDISRQLNSDYDRIIRKDSADK